MSGSVGLVVGANKVGELLVAAARPDRGGESPLLDPHAAGALLWFVAVALLVTAGCALVTRVLGVGWTWTLAWLPVIGATWLVASGLAPAVALGILLAAGTTAWWEHEDIQRGGQEAQRVRERLGLFSWLYSLHKLSRARRDRVRAGRVAVGQTPDRKVVSVPFGDGQGRRGFICGAPGTGKTIDVASLATAYASQGLPVVCVDPKGDRSLEGALERSAALNRRAFVTWAPDGSVSYNPLARGGPTEIADKALAGEMWSEPHYLRQAQRYLGAVLRAMKGAGEWPPTLTGVVRYFDVDRAEAVAKRAGEEARTEMSEYLDSLSQRSRQELGGVRDRLGVLAESELGKRLEPERGFAELELEGALRRGAVAYFRLDSDRYPLAAEMLGAAIVSDLVNLTGQLQSEPLRGLVVVDEFAAVAADQISRLLGRSRSAGMSVIVATQTLADLDQARPGDSTGSLRRQVLANVDFVLAHRQSEPEAAEVLAAMAGTRATWVTTRKVGSPFRYPFQAQLREGTRTREREFICHPDEFKRLRVGEAIVIEPSSKGEAGLVRMWSAEVGTANGRPVESERS
jgi:hypothetical protein